MLHNLLGFSAALALFLMLFPSPALSARARLSLHRFRHPHPHHAHHPLHRPIHHRSKPGGTAPSNAINIHMVTANEPQGSSEPNPFMWAPGHSATPNPPTYAKGTSNLHIGVGESNLHIGVPTQVANSMDMVGSRVSKPKTSGHASGPSNPTTNKRSLLDPSHNYDLTLPSGEDLTLFIASLTIQRENNLFSMLPKGQHVSPSGPSKNHNSMITDIPT